MVKFLYEYLLGFLINLHCCNKYISLYYFTFFFFFVKKLTKKDGDGFFKTNNKFSKLYQENHFYIQIGNQISYLDEESYLDFLKTNFEKVYEDKEFVLEYSFKNLKKLKLNQSLFFSKIEN